MINEKVKNQNVTDIVKTPKKSILPGSEKQKKCKSIEASDIIISLVKRHWKTFLAVAVGLTMLLEKKLKE